VFRLRLAEVLKERKLSMNKLSQRSEVTYSIIKEIVRNPYRVVSTETLNRLARALDVPATDLVEDVSEEFAAKERVEKNIK
jgi:DNA-binding Xre family transcriptional regulator